MARSSDTAERTVATAWALLAEGVYPSAQTIRERIRQGSMTTISQALKNDFWPAVAQRLNAPEVPAPLADLTQQLWQRALESADDTLAGYRREIDQRLALADAERTQALTRARALEAETERQRQTLQQQREDGARLSQALRDERDARRDAEHRLLEQTEALKTARLMLAQTEQRLRGELAAEKQRNDANEQRLTRLYDDQKTARERLEQQLEQQIATSRQHSERQHREIGQLGETVAQLRADIAGQQLRIDETQAAATLQRQLREQAQTEIARLQDALARLQQRLDQAEARQTDWRQRADDAERARAGAERESAVLQRQLDALTDKLSRRQPAAGAGRRRAPDA